MASTAAAVDVLDERLQTVVFVRHGVARHNVLDPHTRQRPDLSDPALLDPPLVLEGLKAAIDVGEVIKSWWRHNPHQSFGHEQRHEKTIELVVTSPLTRCIQTAVSAFLPGFSYHDPAVPIICNEDVREAFGMHYPDKRREKSILMDHWPNIEFPEEMTEEDKDWRPDRRETWQAISTRVRRFLDWLVQRPEDNIVVVSHGVWIESLLRTFFHDFLGERRVYNCDAYACQCISRNGSFMCLVDPITLASRERFD